MPFCWDHVFLEPFFSRFAQFGFLVPTTSGNMFGMTMRSCCLPLKAYPDVAEPVAFLDGKIRSHSKDLVILSWRSASIINSTSIKLTGGEGPLNQGWLDLALQLLFCLPLGIAAKLCVVRFWKRTPKIPSLKPAFAEDLRRPHALYLQQQGRFYRWGAILAMLCAFVHSSQRGRREKSKHTISIVKYYSFIFWPPPSEKVMLMFKPLRARHGCWWQRGFLSLKPFTLRRMTTWQLTAKQQPFVTSLGSPSVSRFARKSFQLWPSLFWRIRSHGPHLNKQQGD